MPAGPPQDKKSPYVLEDQIGFILRQVQQRYAVIFASRFGSDITPTQWAVIAKLAEVGDVSQNLLGRHTAMDVATIKGVVERLVKRGLLQATPDATDRRRLSISLSDAGRAAYAEHLAHAFAVTRETLEPLTDEERSSLLATLEKLR